MTIARPWRRASRSRIVAGAGTDGGLLLRVPKLSVTRETREPYGFELEMADGCTPEWQNGE